VDKKLEETKKPIPANNKNLIFRKLEIDHAQSPGKPMTGIFKHKNLQQGISSTLFA
jgi:hypothetical protein